MIREAGPTAALAGVPAGVQSQGVWIGRRQLFVRFAGEAETASMYTAEALARELKRMSGRAVFHSISISGSAPFGSRSFSDVPVDSMNGFDGSFRATAVFQSRAYAPASMACRSQRGVVSHVYFSFQLCPCGRGFVTLFQG